MDSNILVPNFADLNEDGLTCIDERNFRRAIHLYRHALNCLNEERNRSPPPVGPFRGRFRSLAIPLEWDDYYFGRNVTLKEATTTQDGRFELYDVAFLIEYENVFFAYSYAVTTVLYNMALCLHVQALVAPDHSKLKQAKDIYVKAIDFFESTAHKCFVRDTRRGERRGLAFGLANNLGHCAALLCDEDGVRRAQHLIKRLLDDNSSSEALSIQDDSKFRMSVVIGLLHDEFGPPPAPQA